MTVLVYLNDVPKGGETAFPIADVKSFSHAVFQFLNRIMLQVLNRII